MADSAKDKLQGMQLELKRHVELSIPAASVHHFGFVAVDDDVLLEVSHFDLTQLRSVVEGVRLSGKRKNHLDIYVIGRYSVGPKAALGLLNTANRMVEHYRQLGRITDDNQPSTSTTDED